VIRVAPDGTLTLGTTAHVVADPVLVQHDVELRYVPDEPYAVGLAFSRGAAAPATGAVDGNGNAPAGVLWRLDREVLVTGHGAAELCGDVRVTRLPALGVVIVELMPDSPWATIVRFEAEDLDAFLLATFRAVPAGTESLDVDGLIRQLLEAA
jgi:hypothetical protein